jgi:hypothetical protein
MQYLAKLETRCGCSRETWVTAAHPRFIVPMEPDRKFTMDSDFGVMHSQVLTTREFRLERRVGTVLYYREML